MNNLQITLLALLGLFTGGCSIYFVMGLIVLTSDPIWGVMQFAIPGLAITILCAWRILWLRRRST